MTPHRLRRLTLDPALHPEGRAHISAASGLVCKQGKTWVIGDDEQHLACFHNAGSPGDLHRLLPGDLPTGKAARKKRKADLETLFWWPASNALVTLGSGCAAGRQRGVAMGLDQPCVHSFTAQPWFEPLRERLGGLNIEGAFVWQGHVVLLNRGHANGGVNAAAGWRFSDFEALMAGNHQRTPPRWLREFDLGTINGTAWGFTDGKALPDGSGWLFSAAAEASDDSVADGQVLGAMLGRVNARGEIQAQRRLDAPHKVEGIDMQQRTDGLHVFMVTDADDPTEASWLLSARW
jgi:hypothetical protein